MNNCQLALSGLAFTNSNSIVQGNFYKPDTILDTVRMSKPLAAGVIVITAKHASGRIGVANNCVLVGAVVDGSGETGIGAVYKLLLVPHGTFNFRQLLPQEEWHLQQDLNLHVNEVKSSLAGPSSIGLARPADISLTKLTAIAPVANSSSASSYSGTEPSDVSMRYSNDGLRIAGSTSIVNNTVSPSSRSDHSEEYNHGRRTIKINNYEQTVTNAFVAECSKLMQSVPPSPSNQAPLMNSVEKSQTGEIVRPRSLRTTDPNLVAMRKTDPQLRALKVVSESDLKPSKSAKSRQYASAALIAVVMGFILSVGIASHSGSNRYVPSSPSAQSAQAPNSTAEFMAAASANSSAASATSEDLRIKGTDSTPDLQATVTKPSPIFSIANAETERPSPNHTTFILPGAAPINSSPPPVSNSQSTETSTATNATLDGLLAKSKIESENMSFWVQAVKNNPNDAIAREHLAYKLLANGQPRVSVQQFQAMMVIRQPGSEEISKYVDALVLFGEKRLAQQFLTSVLTADPSKEALRQKLQSIQ